MITNVVFDIGNVLCEWNAEKLLNTVFTESRHKKLARQHILDHDDWLQLDKGTLELPSAIRRAEERSGLSRKQVVKLFERTPPSLVPFPDTIRLISFLKKKGLRLYVLSNMHEHAYEYLRAHYSFWGEFDGLVISSWVQSIKPEPAIYSYLLGHYNLDPAATLFLDDLPINVEAAQNQGIQAVVVQNPVDVVPLVSQYLGLEIASSS